MCRIAVMKLKDSNLKGMKGTTGGACWWGELASAFELRSGQAENEREMRMLCSRCRTTAALQPRQGCPAVTGGFKR